MRKEFSNAWKSSTQPRKQRKFRHNAPKHIKQKFMSSHLSKELRKKYSRRSIVLRKSDKVLITTGQHKGKTGKIDRVDTKNEAVYITGIDFTKKEGSKVMFKFHPSNLVILELNLDDKKRLKKLEKNRDNKQKDTAKNAKTKESKK
ncbi:MAG: 50S ribosomal protein L24 [Nanoarchaeota archaeon]|nr:50S ribosomal protein L24 [Nanoarchaeota archaeon]